jgi:glycosyltransferase involved in cell wall biosynthesis
MRKMILAVYGIEAEVLPAPHALDACGPQRRIGGLEPGFFLCVSRLLPYKNVDAVVDAFAGIRGERIVIVGTGPEEDRLRAAASGAVRFTGSLHDDRLRWLYANATALVAASYEDYGLTPLEAASFGRPTLALRAGGYLDTVIDGETGLFFDRPKPKDIACAVRRLRSMRWDQLRIVGHASRYSEDAFIARLRQIVAEESGRGEASNTPAVGEAGLQAS